eukprot:gene25474-30756_t
MSSLSSLSVPELRIPQHARAKSETLESSSKSGTNLALHSLDTSSAARIRFQSASLANLEDISPANGSFPNTFASHASNSTSAHTGTGAVEIKKSKSLTRKIRELNSSSAASSGNNANSSGNMRDAGINSANNTPISSRGKALLSPVPPIHDTSTSVSASPLVNGNSASSGSNKPAVHIPSLTLERMHIHSGAHAPSPALTPSSSGGLVDIAQHSAASAPSAPAPYQHYSLPKSLHTSSPHTTHHATHHNAHTKMFHASPKVTNAKVSSAQPPLLQLSVPAEALEASESSTHAKDKDRDRDLLQLALENDRILQERLQEAKALSRKDMSLQAVEMMASSHSNGASAKQSGSLGMEGGGISKSNGATMHSFSLWKKGGLQQTQQQQHRLHEALNVSSSSILHLNTSAADDDNDNSNHNDSPSYSDDDFEEEGEGTSAATHHVINAHSNNNSGSSVGGLADSRGNKHLPAVLRGLVVDAQALLSPSLSPIRPAHSNSSAAAVARDEEDEGLGYGVEEALEHSYASFAQRPVVAATTAVAEEENAHNNSVSLIDAFDGEVSSESGDDALYGEDEEDEGTRSVCSDSCLVPSQPAAPALSMMSMSGPATFLNPTYNSNATGPSATETSPSAAAVPALPPATLRGGGTSGGDEGTRRRASEEIHPAHHNLQPHTLKSLTSRDPQPSPPTLLLQQQQHPHTSRAASGGATGVVEGLEKRGGAGKNAHHHTLRSLRDAHTQNKKQGQGARSAAAGTKGTSASASASNLSSSGAADSTAMNGNTASISSRGTSGSSGEPSPPSIDTSPPPLVTSTSTSMCASASAASPMSPLQWKRGELIGEGSFGQVYKGLNEKTGELLAIKQLVLCDGSEKEVEEYLGTDKTDRYLYILLEYVTGGSVCCMLKQFGPFSETLLKRFSCHIFASLEESMLMIRGSIPWMAPEVIKQEGYGRSSDIWSFGATVIEMANGQPPWSEYANNLAAMFHVATTTDPPPPPPSLSPEGQAFVQRCLVIAPDQRCSAMDLLTSPYMKAEYDKYITSLTASPPLSHSHTPSPTASPLVSGRKKAPPPPNLLRAISGNANAK